MLVTTDSSRGMDLASHSIKIHRATMDEKSPLITPDAHEDGVLDVNAPPPSRWERIQHTLVPIVLDIIPDTILGFLVQYSRDDPGARILTAFTFASIVQSQIVAAIQLSLGNKLDGIRSQLADPIKRKELWIYGQAAWLVYMAYVPFAAAACGYTAWAARDGIFHQNADVADVIASLIIINSVSLPFSLGSAIMRAELEAHKMLRPFVIASTVSWTIGLSFAYVLGYWVELGFVGIALTDIITYSIQFRLLLPRTHLFSEWPGWRLREALPLVPRLACHPMMICILVTNLSTMLFFFSSLLTSLIKVNVVIEFAQTNIFPSLLMLSFMPLFGLGLYCSMVIKDGLSKERAPMAVNPIKLVVFTVLMSVITTFAWIVGGLHQGTHANPPVLVDWSKDLLSALVPLFPSLGFVFLIRPVFRTSAELWHDAGTTYIVLMSTGAALGAALAELLDGGIQGLWLGQYLCIQGFVFVATQRITSKAWSTSDARSTFAAVVHPSSGRDPGVFA